MINLLVLAEKGLNGQPRTSTQYTLHAVYRHCVHREKDKYYAYVHFGYTLKYTKFGHGARPLASFINSLMWLGSTYVV